MNKVEKWKVEKILNKRKIREAGKYLVHQKRFIAENNIQERKEDLKNAKEAVAEFKKKISVKFRQQEKVGRKDLDQVQKMKLNPNAKKFRRSKLLEKYTAKILFEKNDRKFKNKDLKKLKRNWQRQKSVSLEKKL